MAEAGTVTEKSVSAPSLTPPAQAEVLQVSSPVMHKCPPCSLTLVARPVWLPLPRAVLKLDELQGQEQIAFLTPVEAQPSPGEGQKQSPSLAPTEQVRHRSMQTSCSYTERI